MNNTQKPEFLGRLKKKSPEKWFDKLKNNPLSFISTIWLIGLSIGGIFFLLYFWWINYFPEIDLTSATSFLVAMAITGTGLVIVLAFYLIFPGLYWREIVCQEAALKPLLWDDKEDKPALFNAFFLFICPPAATVFSFAFPICWPIAISVNMLVTFYLFINFHCKSFKEKLLLYIYVVLNTFVFFVPVFLAFLFNSGIPTEEFNSTIFITLTTIFAANYFVVVARLKELKWRSYSVFAVIVLLAVSVGTQKTFLIPQIIVKKFKFGNIDARLVLDEQGCAIAKSYNLNPEISVFRSSSISNSTIGATTKTTSITNDKSVGIETCLISNIKIKSKIGKEFYLQASGVPEQNGNQISESDITNFSIPSEHVLSWSIIEKTTVP